MEQLKITFGASGQEVGKQEQENPKREPVSKHGQRHYKGGNRPRTRELGEMDKGRGSMTDLVIFYSPQIVLALTIVL